MVTTNGVLPASTRTSRTPGHSCARLQGGSSRARARHRIAGFAGCSRPRSRGAQSRRALRTRSASELARLALACASRSDSRRRIELHGLARNTGVSRARSMGGARHRGAIYRTRKRDATPCRPAGSQGTHGGRKKHPRRPRCRSRLGGRRRRSVTFGGSSTIYTLTAAGGSGRGKKTGAGCPRNSRFPQPLPECGRRGSAGVAGRLRSAGRCVYSNGESWVDSRPAGLYIPLVQDGAAVADRVPLAHVCKSGPSRQVLTRASGVCGVSDSALGRCVVAVRAGRMYWTQAGWWMSARAGPPSCRSVAERVRGR